MSWFFSAKDKKNIRVKADPGNEKEKYVTVSLTNSFDFLQVLSLKLTQSEVYRLFDSPYGVLAGRVLGNDSVGIPNCKISLFIPRENGTESEKSVIKVLDKHLVDNYYPYDKVTDENGEGLRYNLLTNQSRSRGYNGFPYNDLGIGFTPKTPVGSFPEKEELLSNDFFLTVYNKYYCYTTVTNESGDYMIFGVPTGTYMLHMDCDLTDIGRWSLTPSIMSHVLGYPSNLFQNEGTEIVGGTDLSKIPNVQSQNISVKILPFWTQRTDANEVGITRQDIKLTVPIMPSFTIFGSNFTMAKNRWWGDNVFFRIHFGWKNLCFGIGGCGTDESCDSKVELCIGLRIKSLGINLCVGNICDKKPNDTLFFCFNVQIANIVPFVSFEFGDNYCRLDGGKYDSNSFDFINHGETCKCSIKDALKEIPDSGITDALFLHRHRTDKINVRLFSLNPNTISDSEGSALYTSIRTNTSNLPIVNNALLDRLNPTTDIELVDKSKYAEILDNGQFIFQIPTDRRRMITDEEGNLIDSPRSDLGVFTEFRGYIYLDSDGDLDSPEGKDKIARLAYKIPQLFDYGDSKNTITKTKEWLFNHSLFKAGEIYSIAQKLPVRNSDFSADEEKDSVTFNGDGTDFDTGTPFEPNFQNTDEKGWDIQTGILLFTKDPDITVVPALSWEHTSGNIIRNGVNGLPDYTVYPVVQDAMISTHQTSIGRENSYKINGQPIQPTTLGNLSGPTTSGGLITYVLIQNPTVPTSVNFSFPNDDFTSAPTTNFILHDYNPDPLNITSNGLCCNIDTSLQGSVFLSNPSANPTITVMSKESILIHMPFSHVYDYSLGLPGIIGATNYEQTNLLDPGQNGIYTYRVEVAFIDTNNLYTLTSEFDISLDGSNTLSWKIEIPQIELSAAANAGRNTYEVRIRVRLGANASLYFWTPKIIITT